MKNLFTFICCLLTLFSLNAEINYIDYGDGLVISMNENYAMDLDEDDVVDFYINGVEGELGFVPIFAKGCFTSPSLSAVTSWGARELDIHNVGDVISLTDFNMFDYIDEDRGSIYDTNAGLATGWVDNEDFYLGFAVFADDFKTLSNGWMKVSVNVEDETLTIKEIAFTDFQYSTVEPIVVGDTGTISSVLDSDENLPISVLPNPATDNAIVNFTFESAMDAELSVFSMEGKLVYREGMNHLIGEKSINLMTSEWSNGIYFVKLETIHGIQTQKLMVSH